MKVNTAYRRAQGGKTGRNVHHLVTILSFPGGMGLSDKAEG